MRLRHSANNVESASGNCAPADDPRTPALYPFIIQLERAAGLARDDSVEEKLGKLRSLLEPMGPSNNEIELLAELLSFAERRRRAQSQPTAQT